MQLQLVTRLPAHRGRVHHGDLHLPLGALPHRQRRAAPGCGADVHCLFICEQDIQDAFKGLPHFEESGDEPSVHKYNELATLMHVSGACAA